jgi:hypothetical protein
MKCWWIRDSIYVKLMSDLLRELIDCDTGHHVMVAKVTERLSVSKRAVLKFDMETCNLENLNDVEV